VVPGIAIAAPRDGLRLQEELREAIAISDAPTVIRFPKGNLPLPIEAITRLPGGVDILSQAPSKDVLLVAVGSFAKTAIEVAQMLADQGIGATVVDPRWVLPISQDLIDLAAKHRLVVTLEDGVRVGGFGTRLRQDLRAKGVDTGLNEVGIPAEFLEHAERDEILERLGLTAKAISRDIVAQVLGSKLPHAKPLENQAQTELDSDQLL
jgi:1-deoxy-D-xylulose-5-phosphate synthase